jgi:hypothetical protein
MVIGFERRASAMSTSSSASRLISNRRGDKPTN